jgi:undecaprenyl-diphosphatase
VITVAQAAILGTVQGATEFLPISSSAHLKIVPWLLRWDMPREEMAFDVALHFGTLIAMVLLFFFEWLMIIASYIGDVRQRNWKGGQQGSLLLKIALACIPAAVIGKLFERKIENYFWADPSHIWWLAVTMSVFGVLLVVSERLGKQNREVKQVTFPDALVIGSFQAIALIPGTSRSGITIIAALLLGLTRPAAARFSFLVALPITFGAVLLKAKDLRGVESWTPLAVGIIMSAIVGIFAIKGLLHYVKHHSYLVFAIYRWFVAAAIIVVFLNRH